MSYQKNLIGDKRFWPMFWTQFFGAFNDNVFKNAMVILIAFKSYSLAGLNSEQMVALCGGVFILPFFLFSAIAGQVCDRSSKSQLIFYIKVLEIIIMLIGGVGFLIENLPLLMAALFLMGFQSTLFGPVKYSVLPELLEEEELVHGNALIEMGTFVSILLGTILGGVLMGLGESGRTYVSIAVVLFAVVGTLFSRKVNRLEPVQPELKVHYGLIKPTWEIIKITREVRSVFLSVLGISWFWFFGAVLLSVFPIYVKNILNGNEHLVTLFLALFSIGVAIGSVGCERLSRKRLELGLVPFGTIGMTLFILDLYIVGVPSFVSDQVVGVVEIFKYKESIRILFDLLMLSVFSGFFIVPLYTFIQQRSRSEVRSRIIAGNNILNALFMVASAIMLTVAYGMGLTVIEVFLILAILNAVVSTYIYTIIPEFLLRFFCVILTRLIYRVRVVGDEHIPHDGPAVLVCNHVTFVDWLILAAAIKRPIRFVMHSSFLSLPLIGFLFRDAKVIPIAGKKEDPAMMEKAFEKISEELREGELVCIFPEGQLTYDGELSPFKPGIERIVQETPVPVIPMVLKGLWGSFFSRKYNGKGMSEPSIILKTIWSKVELEVFEAIPAKDVKAAALEELTRKRLEKL